MKIFLCGDVMLGRGIDQGLPRPCAPRLHEASMDFAVGYLRLAEQANGPIPRPLDFAYVWGAALMELNRTQPHARIINLETSITRSEDFEPKGINYRMSPENAGCLATAGIDCCALANNHVLDWGRAGLLDTLAALHQLAHQDRGSGSRSRRGERAGDPGRRRRGTSARIFVRFGDERHATALGGTGRCCRSEFSACSVRGDGRRGHPAGDPGEAAKRYRHRFHPLGIELGLRDRGSQRWFAHALVDRANVSIVYGHSSHHAKGLEVYNNRLILYGCGDFLNDYEGIRGYEEFRDDLALMYFASVDLSSADLLALEMVPLQSGGFS